MHLRISATASVFAGLGAMIWSVVKVDEQYWYMYGLTAMVMTMGFAQYYRLARQIGGMPGPDDRPRKGQSRTQYSMREASANYWRGMLEQIQMAIIMMLVATVASAWPQHNPLVEKLHWNFLTADATYRVAPALVSLALFWALWCLLQPEHLKVTKPPEEE